MIQNSGNFLLKSNLFLLDLAFFTWYNNKACEMRVILCSKGAYGTVNN